MKDCYFDTETTGLSPHLEDRAYAVAFIFGTLEDPDVRYFEWMVDPLTRKVKTKSKDLIQIQKWMADLDVRKILFNAKFDLTHLIKHGVDIEGRIEDVSFAARIWNTQEFNNDLKTLSERFFGIKDDDRDFLQRWTVKLRSRARKRGWKLSEDVEADYWLCQHVDELMPELPKKERELIKGGIKEYCVRDVVRTILCWKMYEPEINNDPLLKGTYEREIELLPIVMEMEETGMALSANRLKTEKENAQKVANECLLEITRMAAEKKVSRFNSNSPAQVSKLLYTPEPKGFGLKCHGLTKSGKPSTDWKSLAPHANHPFVQVLSAYNSSTKALNTFFQKYEDMKRPCKLVEDFFDLPDELNLWALHPSLNQCGTKTLRFSCNNPNLQQVANSDSSPRGADPIQARAPFGPRPGYRWYSFDFSQMELRVFADVADVPSMLEAIDAGRDLNTENANRAWGGKGNPYACEAAAYSLELGSKNPGRKEVLQVWDEIGWNDSKALKGIKSTLALQAADDWLSQFDYDIVEAEKSIGKKATRSRAKIVMFCKIYGGGPSAVTSMLFCTEEEARAYWNQYDRAFPEIVHYIKNLSRQAEKDGFIINRYDAKIRVDPQFAYKSVNYMIQSSCALLMKEGILKTYRFLKRNHIDGRQIIPVHDELIFELHEDYSYKWLLRELGRLMEEHEGRFRVTMPVECHRVDLRWDHVTDVKL